jgi:hypothetical protein
MAFSHYFKDERLKTLEYHFKEDYYKKIKSIDINGCRRNITKYTNYNFCKYSILDNWENYDDGSIQDGNYYIETDDYSLFHKNGVYSKPIIEYGLKLGIITKDNIKKQFIASSTIDKSYFTNFINYIWDLFKDCNNQKLAVNSWIGTMGRRDSRFIQNDYSKKDDIYKIGEIYEKYSNPYINDFGEILSITNEVKIEKLETSYYVYNQILDIEAVELHKLLEKVKNINGIPICVKTYCVMFYHNNEKPLNIDCNFWDKEKKVLKYKY